MPLQATSGAASYDAFGGGVAAVPTYIEDVFSTYLYTGTGNSVTQRIASGIDLATKGGMVWVKNRTEATDHQIYDTARGQRKYIRSNTTDAEFDSGANQVQYKTSGWDAFEYTNELNKVMASWTFRKQPKFFDVVTYTGTGSARTVAHNLGSVPACIIVKSTSGAGSWPVYHRGVNGGTNPQNYAMTLNATAAQYALTNFWNDTAPTSTVFTVGAAGGETNETGVTYVAYLFAHDAGGFGLTGTDNVISCGSYVGNGVTTGPTVTLGYEPQLLIVKKASDTADWLIYDNMRNSGSWGTRLNPNLPNAENSNAQAQFEITSTGFYVNSLNNSSNSSTNTSGATYIYIAIRRGPMKVPTSGTSVFNIVSRTGTGAAATVTGVGFPVDLVFAKNQSQTTFYWDWLDRLRGPDRNLFSNATDAEYSNATVAYQSLTSFANMDGVVLGADGWNAYINGASNPYTNYFMRRAPSFFDEVCYTGTGSATTFSHNLGVAPEMMIVKERSGTGDWWVYNKSLGSGSPQTKALYLSFTDAEATVGVWNNTAPTSSVFSVSSSSAANGSGLTYVAYLFATCAGVSKVGSYTGTGTTKQVDCGFTGGARFVLIKRTDSTGDWYVWDSARGIVSGNDPYLLLNSTAAETTGTDYIDTYSAGFEISSTAPAAINASGGTFIFLAIA